MRDHLLLDACFKFSFGFSASPYCQLRGNTSPLDGAEAKLSLLNQYSGSGLRLPFSIQKFISSRASVLISDCYLNNLCRKHVFFKDKCLLVHRREQMERGARSSHRLNKQNSSWKHLCLSIPTLWFSLFIGWSYSIDTLDYRHNERLGESQRVTHR